MLDNNLTLAVSLPLKVRSDLILQTYSTAMTLEFFRENKYIQHKYSTLQYIRIKILYFSRAMKVSPRGPDGFGSPHLIRCHPPMFTLHLPACSSHWSSNNHQWPSSNNHWPSSSSSNHWSNNHKLIM